ncbi:hypothetical protein CO115_04815 [Candidatus Falkowbacteria bacterium CG_4_9_14_3_um_filter_36_9]|uniref:Cell shape determination protein CcmA n=1 Tax=Candidatus Falkowbacteria bacterium CG02_land_8_20_14_3_00_36_14 TaxID=1974560 RepID=A0A2M7DQB4_9BACT|nr:MAG: hypothetical protein COS18_01285 [Candidatus Falkowbacteria bacterium CG02_land_8_20_14_3_00_36_14]PIX12013.1 MAG: hypothetical protein COZ73_01265 [Candidatus Falkowbacteria bacterium CG_4_8_14_3_um_filter_36_11]PJA11025.1 MAG: hypothetical protein COX67_01945 [Candidatus Falkowbacteria bacterium CG_4_10_14_0_2_um_filter_36_22]PJB18330.1 MAG: hypothetical protein CO115_04815 [Candidatus Falkowbacteria bacterium CG_4_9_14_3_um_filter_36_9]
MFKKQNEETLIKDAETIIGPSIKIKGDFFGKGNIIVEGILEGSLKTSSGLYVGDKAKITAAIEAKDAKIGGEVKGNIKIKGYLEILATAKINGDVEALGISVAKGAFINGRLTMKTDEKESADLKKIN